MVGKQQDDEAPDDGGVRGLSEDDPLMELASLVSDFSGDDDDALAFAQPAEAEKVSETAAEPDPEMPRVPIDEPVPDFDDTIFSEQPRDSSDALPGSYAVAKPDNGDDLDRASPVLESTPLSAPDDLPELDESLFFDVEDTSEEGEADADSAPAETSHDTYAAPDDEPGEELVFTPFQIEDETDGEAEAAQPLDDSSVADEPDEPAATISLDDEADDFESLETAFGAEPAPIDDVTEPEPASEALEDAGQDPDGASLTPVDDDDLEATLHGELSRFGMVAEPEPAPVETAPASTVPMDDDLEAALLAELSETGTAARQAPVDPEPPVDAPAALSIEDELLSMLEGTAPASAAPTPVAAPPQPAPKPDDIIDAALDDLLADPVGQDAEPEADPELQSPDDMTPGARPAAAMPEPAVAADPDPVAETEASDEQAMSDLDDDGFAAILDSLDTPRAAAADPAGEFDSIDIALDEDFSGFFDDEPGEAAGEPAPVVQEAVSAESEPETEDKAARTGLAGAAVASLGGVAAVFGRMRGAKARQDTTKEQDDEPQDAGMAGFSADDDLDAVLASAPPGGARSEPDGAETEMSVFEAEAPTAARPAASPLDELEAIMGSNAARPADKKGVADMDRHSGAPLVDTVDMPGFDDFDDIDFDVPDLEPEQHERPRRGAASAQAGLPPLRASQDRTFAAPPLADPAAGFDDELFEAELARDLEFVRHDAAAQAEHHDLDDLHGDLTADEAPAARPTSRKGLYVAGIIGAIALIGAAGLMLFSAPADVASDGPVLVEADPEPIKVEPENPGGSEVPNQDRAVFSEAPADDAVTQDSLVTTAEEPVAIATAPATPLPSAVNGKSEERLSPGETETAAADSGGDNVLVAPRRVRTLIVRADGTLVEQPDPAPQVASAAEPVTESTSVEAGGVTFQLPTGGSEGEASQVPVRTVQTQTITAPAESAPAPAQEEEVAAVEPAPAPAPEPTPAPAPAAASSPFSVQISAVPDAEAAQRTSADLQRRFASILSGRGISIQRADLEGRGTFYRIRVGAESRADANDLCERYKRAGGSCFVTR